MRFAAMRQDAEKWNIRAFCRQRVIDVVTQVYGVAPRHAIQQEAQSLRIRFPIFYIIHRHGATEQFAGIVPCKRMAQLAAGSARE